MAKDLVKRDENESPRAFLDQLPVVTEARCNICKSEYRSIIDRMIAGPYSYTAIARQFRGKDKYLSGSLEAVRKSVERHAKRHVNVRDAAVRQIIEQRAMEAGLLVEDVKNQYLTLEALLELYVQKGFEQVTDPESRVRHQDILEAVKIIEQMRKDTVQEEIEVMKKQVYAISQAVKELVAPEQHPAIVARAHEIFAQSDLSLPQKQQSAIPQSTNGVVEIDD